MSTVNDLFVPFSIFNRILNREVNFLFFIDNGKLNLACDLSDNNHAPVCFEFPDLHFEHDLSNKLKKLYLYDLAEDSLYHYLNSDEVNLSQYGSFMFELDVHKRLFYNRVHEFTNFSDLQSCDYLKCNYVECYNLFDFCETDDPHKIDFLNQLCENFSTNGEKYLFKDFCFDYVKEHSYTISDFIKNYFLAINNCGECLFNVGVDYLKKFSDKMNNYNNSFFKNNSILELKEFNPIFYKETVYNDILDLASQYRNEKKDSSFFEDLRKRFYGRFLIESGFTVNILSKYLPKDLSFSEFYKLNKEFDNFILNSHKLDHVTNFYSLEKSLYQEVLQKLRKNKLIANPYVYQKKSLCKNMLKGEKRIK